MKIVDICKKLDQTTYRIRAYLEEGLIGEGTGFCYNKHGGLITAAHVLNNNKPFRKKEKGKIKVIANAKYGPEIQYHINLCGITINWPDGPLKEDIVIDLAVLSPKVPLQNAPFLKVEAEEQEQKVGTEVVMAGFPDEIEFPLLLTKKMDRKHLNKAQSVEETNKNLERLNSALIMQKKGMVGFSEGLIIDPQHGNNFKLHVGVNYIDNGMHSGASGGPVVNNRCEVIGVITKRAVTGVSYVDMENPNQEVPSGSTLSITPQTIIDFINYQLYRGKIEN